MGIIARDHKQLTLIYSSNTGMGAKVHAYAQAANEKLLAIDIAKTKVSDSQWAEIACKLGVSLGDLLVFPASQKPASEAYSTDDWLKILQHDDRVLEKPIIINGDRIKQLESYTSMLEFLGPDSAGIEKTMYTERPPTSGANTKKK
jgi:arsenate reductase-like glutaredoxin family protein